MADHGEHNVNDVEGSAADDVSAASNIQQALLISCMQKIVIYETKAVRYYLIQ